MDITDIGISRLRIGMANERVLNVPSEAVNALKKDMVKFRDYIEQLGETVRLIYEPAAPIGKV